MSIIAAVITFVCVFSCGMLGISLHKWMPVEEETGDTKDVVKLIMGLVATITALVLSLLIAASSNFYNTQQAEIQQLGVNVASLDAAMARYGTETMPARVLLREEVAGVLAKFSPEEGVGSDKIGLHKIPPPNDLFNQVETLTPKTEGQHYTQQASLQLMQTIASTLLLIHEQVRTAIPLPLLTVLVCWLGVLFVGFGLFVRANVTALTAFFVGALCVSTAMFLLLEMGHPYSGVMRISMAPLQNALIPIQK